ncbi:MAG: ATP-binding protein [Cyclobacteriaceae bacterium]
MKAFVLLFFFSSSVGICSAQANYSLGDDKKARIAELEKEIEQTNSDSLRAYDYFKLSSWYTSLYNDSVKTDYYLKKGLALVERNPFIKAVSYYYIARSLYYKGDLPSIEYNLNKADSLLKQFSYAEAYRIRGHMWQNYASLQQNTGNDSIAMRLLLNRALPNAKESKDFSLLGRINRDIATNLMNINQREKATFYLVQAESSIEKTPLENVNRFVELAATYNAAAENYVELGMYDSATKPLNKAKLILLAKPNATSIHLDYYYVEGLYFDRTSQYSLALKSFNKGIKFPGAEQSPIFLNRLKYAKYKTLSKEKDYESAIKVMEDLLKAPSLLARDLKLYYQDLHNTYAKLGNISKAYYWSKKYIALSDSLYEAKYQNDIAEMEVKFNNAESQLKITTLHAEKEKAELTSKSNRSLATLLGTISFFLLITVAFGLMHFRDSKKLSEQKEINYQQKLKEAEQQQQIQFTKALIQGEEKERKRLAGDLHDGLGGMLARVKINLSKLVTHNHEPTMTPDLNKVIDQLDNSVNELRRIARNMMPESLVSLGLEAALMDMCISLTSDTTHVNFQAFDISPSIAKDTQSTIYRIVQELLTNAIRHAKASQIVVQCSQNGSTFFITVEDNGIGFDAKKILLKNGIGLGNVKSRVDYLGGKLDISSTPGDGTTINIELNVVS